MVWLSITQNVDALDPVAAHSRPWAKVEKFWRFCNRYGDYQATPPRLRRQFIIEMERARSQAKSCADAQH
ncbi:hypothetical protein VB780_07815 [Leptolyngbya sp. CCNP1308]|uniref:hypothetical protein n=1 Tax=Leptolyngbya sp. CCNP1308 TaxID=3110255 RepID=UPI002B20D867|nr:hypothetical protein [Leptolyngbya sp. CCNP1308]MEA5448468.1 hypothetical protein [Leptolyngbya sp. CCNP1308]